MSRQGSGLHPQRVHIPQVPDIITRSPHDTMTRGHHNATINHAALNALNHNDRNTYGSIGADDSFPPPPSPLLMAKNTNKGTASRLDCTSVLSWK